MSQRNMYVNMLSPVNALYGLYDKDVGKDKHKYVIFRTTQGDWNDIVDFLKNKKEIYVYVPSEKKVIDVVKLVNSSSKIINCDHKIELKVVDENVIDTILEHIRNRDKAHEKFRPCEITIDRFISVCSWFSRSKSKFEMIKGHFVYQFYKCTVEVPFGDLAVGTVCSYIKYTPGTGEITVRSLSTEYKYKINNSSDTGFMYDGQIFVQLRKKSIEAPPKKNAGKIHEVPEQKTKVIVPKKLNYGNVHITKSRNHAVCDEEV